MSTTFSIGAMNQLGNAFERAGFSAEDVTNLTRFVDLKRIKDVLDGKAEIKYFEHLIDCDANPEIPGFWSVEEHRPSGMFKFNSEKIVLYLSKKQKPGSFVSPSSECVLGYDLHKELEGKSVLNSNVLDYLLKRPELIPKEWKKQKTCFWGTIYRDYGKEINAAPKTLVRYLLWNGKKWSWDYKYLDDYFLSNEPAALAS